MNQVNKTKKQLVTFALFAYNQEKYVREAVEGALLQTYSPLEIILSDDCSTDLTFEIIQEMVNGYNGSHKIILNRNDNNYGMANHINKIFNMASGELIVMAAGDDISLPTRTEILVKNWLLYNKPTALQSSNSRINEFGREIIENALQIDENIYVKSSFENLLKKAKGKEKLKFIGAASAYSKSSIREFGSIPDYVVAEDAMLSFRALFLNGILHIKDVLVKYRAHENNVTKQYIYRKNVSPIQFEKEFSEKRKIFFSVHASRLHDIKYALKHNYIDYDQHEVLKHEISRRNEVIQSIVNWWTLNYFVRISKNYKRIVLDGNTNEKRWAKARLLPMPLFVLWRYAKIIYRRFRNFAFK